MSDRIEAGEGKSEIPVPILLRLYRQLRRWPVRRRLEFALALEANPHVLARWINKSVERFTPYTNVAQRFCAHEPLEPTRIITTGREFARALAAPATGKPTWQIPYGKRRIQMTVVDYEVPPATTTKDAEAFLNSMGALGRSTLLKTDLLLRHGDGTPIVGEVKVARPHELTANVTGGFDADAVLALIQALAAASMLATPNQIRRLRTHYDAFADATSAVDVALFMYKPERLARSTYQWRLDAIAWLLAHRCFQQPNLTPAIRNIYFIEARGNPEALELNAVATVGRP